jgi:NAD-dependent dihydropyrimidine dehydrogenase PreA subunit
MPHVIDADTCISCAACEAVCESDAISETDDAYAIDPEACSDCGNCAEACPSEAISQA